MKNNELNPIQSSNPNRPKFITVTQHHQHNPIAQTHQISEKSSNLRENPNSTQTNCSAPSDPLQTSEKTQSNQPKPKSSMNPTDQRETRHKQTNRPTPTTSPPQLVNPNQSTTTTTWGSHTRTTNPQSVFHNTHQQDSKIFPLFSSHQDPMASMIKTSKISPLICSPLVEREATTTMHGQIGCKVLSGDEILRLERVWVSRRCVVEKKAKLVSSGHGAAVEREFEIREILSSVHRG